MTKYHDITNQTFGKLTAIEKVIRAGRSLWLFSCRCGQLVEHHASRVASGHIKSCGCTSKVKLAKEKSLINEIYKHNYNDGDLSLEKFSEMIFQNCYYCNSPPSNVYYRKNSRNKKIVCSVMYNGLDRLDSTLPHNLDNVVPCCSKCNRIKSNMYVGEFLHHIKAIYCNRIAK